MKYGDELVLEILKKEFRRQCSATEKAKAACQEMISAPSELIKLRQQANVVLSKGNFTQEGLEQLEDLAKREKNLVNIMKKDLVKLMDKESETENLRDELAREIRKLEFRVGMRKGGSHL
ncbi:hypothetical protein ACE02Z_05030 [Shewanella xiamenensis]|uniref:hypothetical protein n=1 Tax=Shewanella xiamenensis TaxID=332186 RepID=UPI00313B306B